MTQLDPNRRCDLTQALLHEYFLEFPRATEPLQLPKKSNGKEEDSEPENKKGSCNMYIMYLYYL